MVLKDSLRWLLPALLAGVLGAARADYYDVPDDADVATPILRERVERELGIPPAYLVLLATHNHQGPIQIAEDNFDYGRELAEKIFAGIHQAT